MKIKITVLLLLLALAFSFVSCIGPNGDDPNNGKVALDNENIINVYLIAGQSNAVGYGMDTANIIANSDSRFVNGFENVLYYGAQERWNGKNLDRGFAPVTLGMGVAAERSGAEIGIASAIADNGEMNAIIKCAWGATHLYPDTNYDISLKQGTWTSPTYIKNHNIDISKDTMVGNMYRRFEDTVTKGLKMLIEDGYTPVIKGIWWMQGEAEMFTLGMASAYKELYETLIFDMRNTLSEASGYDCSNVPFVCGLPKWNTQNSPAPTYQGMVRTAMETVANSVDNVGCVDCMPLNQHDDWHFDALGQKELGESFIEKVSEFEAANDDGFEEKVSIENEIKLLIDEKGMEFKANLTKFDSKSGNKYGFILVPTEELIKNNINGQYIENLEKLYINYKDIPAEVKVEKIDEQYSDIYFTGKLSDIAYEDLNTAYTVIAYVKNQYGAYSYSSRYVGDSIARLASEELYKDADNAENIQKIINSAINFLNNVPFENRDNAPSFEILAEDEIELALSENEAVYKLEVGTSPSVNYFVKFTSENPDIVSVDENGGLEVTGDGSTYIVIECAGQTKKVKVSTGHLSMDGVILDGVISEGEYLGDVIIAKNANVSAEVVGMVKNGNLYLAFEVVHGDWSSRQGEWWRNDNVEFHLNGESHTVVFYEGEPTYSSNISYGMSKTDEVDGKLVTTIELCVENVPEDNELMLCANGANFGWLAIVHHSVCNTGYIGEDGIVVAKPFDLGNGMMLDGIFDESIYTESVKNNVITANGNGAEVKIIGTLTEQGVVFGLTINHTKSPNVTVVTNGDWFTYMNLEFHFNSKGGEDNQYMFFANNRSKTVGCTYSYSKTVETDSGYTSTIEIFIPYESIGVAAGVESIDFTVRGWLESGWCDLLNNSWNATHKVTSEGLFTK